MGLVGCMGPIHDSKCLRHVGMVNYVWAPLTHVECVAHGCPGGYMGKFECEILHEQELSVPCCVCM